MITLKRVGLEAEQTVQAILDDAPTYTRNTDGIDHDPSGGRDTLTALPPNCSVDQKYVFLIERGGEPVGVVDSNPVQPFWEGLGFTETGATRVHEGRNLSSTKRVLSKTVGQRSDVKLRELIESDWANVHAYASDPLVVKYQAWGPHTEADSREWVKKSIDGQKEHPRSFYYQGICLNDERKVIGGVGVERDQLPERRHCAEIGYSILLSYWGQGIASAAVAQMIELIFSTTDIRRLYAHVRQSNLKSVSLLERLGFVREGTMQDDIVIRGELMSSFLYALLRK